MPRVVIIGAGPAGTAAAITLARLGVCEAREISLIEARAFPRVKVCGECVSPAVTGLVESLVGARAMVGTGARECAQFVLELGERDRPWTMPTRGWAVSRAAFDTLLRDTAAKSGVNIMQPARVRRVDYAPGGVNVQLSDGQRIDAAIVVHADGLGRHDRSGPTPSRPGVVGMKCHYRPEKPVDGIRIRAARGAYIGTVSVERGMATCAMVTASSLIAEHHGDADGMLRAIWPGWRPELREGAWLSCGVADSAYIRPGHPRSFRLGNAAAAVEPVGGEGIGLALWSGTRLAEILHECGFAPDGLTRASEILEHDFRRRLWSRRCSCRAAAMALTRPWLVRSVWPILALPRLTIEPWYALTGKPLSRASPK